jgi:signal transduction histidine kinase
MSDSLTGISDGIGLVDEIGANRMRELQRFAELGRLSASLLHEISNPLTAAILHLEQYHDQESLNIKHVRRNIQLLQRYVEAARQQVRQESLPENFYVRPQLGQIRRLLTPIARRAGVRLRFELPANYRLFGDPVKFQQIISNLVINAIDSYAQDLSLNKHKEVLVTLSSRQQWLFIRVSDRGTGITADELPHLFEPFYTTKVRAGKGLGIGLTAVKQYVEQDFHGAIAVTSSKQRGTQFTARLRTMPRYSRAIVRI